MSSGDGGLALEGTVVPREGARNGDRLDDDVLVGKKALEPLPLLVGVSSFGGTIGRPVRCQYLAGSEPTSIEYLLRPFVMVVEEALWLP